MCAMTYEQLIDVGVKLKYKKQRHSGSFNRVKFKQAISTPKIMCDKRIVLLHDNARSHMTCGTQDLIGDY